MADPSGVAAGADHHRVVEFDVALAVRSTLGPLAGSPGDPTSVVHDQTMWKAMRTPSGHATVAIRQTGSQEVAFWAWGPGAGAALDAAEEWLGLGDDLEAFDPSAHRVVADLARRRAGVRMGRFGQVFDRLVPTILGQLVIAKEAKRSYRRLVGSHGAVAPGPVDLRIPPTPATWAELGSQHFHVAGVERKRARIIQTAARSADRLDRLMDLPLGEAYATLQQLPGIGPWTATSIGRVSFGDPDAVVVGDYNLPHQVAWALAGKRRSDDEEMLRLLAPFPGHRGRVQALLKGAARPPRHGPRLPFREIEQH